MIRLYTFLLFILLSVSIQAQKRKPIIVRDTVEVAVVSKASADSLQKEYIEILKSTNEQLNNYWTPVNWFLGALGVLFAAGAIVAGYLMWLQSKDFKEQREKLFKDIDVRNNEFLMESKEKINAQLQEVEELKSGLNNLKDLSKKEIETAVNGLLGKVENLKESLKQDNIVVKGKKIFKRGDFICQKCGAVRELSFSHEVKYKDAVVNALCNGCFDYTKWKANIV